MALDYQETSRKILAAVGGAENISNATNCMTRLRLTLKDETKANDDQVKSIKGVKSIVKQGGQYQIVIGNEVSNLFKEFSKLGNFTEGSKAAKPTGNAVQRLFGFVAGCMTPLLPAMLGTGMVKVLLTLLTTFGLMDKATSGYVILYGMADSFFYFLPVFLAYQIAKKMNGSPALYMVIATMMVYPDIVNLLAGSNADLPLGTFMGMPATSFFGLPVITATYTSSVLPILLMAPVMKAVEDFADRVSPNVVKAFLKPMLFLLICTPIALCVLGPLGNVIGNVLAGVFSAMYNAVPWLTVGILSALMPFIVMTGMHYALIPLCMNNLATLGFDVIVMVTMFCSNLAQGGASLGVAAKSKNTDTKSEGIACGISAVVAGITEPAMYGINLAKVKPMIAAVIGAGIAGLFTGITGVKGYTMGGSPSLFSIITFIGGEKPMNGVYFGIIGAIIAIGVPFVLTTILYKEDEEETAVTEKAALAVEEEVKKPLVKKLEIASPLTGKVVPMAEIPDEGFSTGVLGECVAVIPEDGNVYAPADGVVTSMMDTKHAIGFTTDDGLELLIHVGIDTVELNGAPFEYKTTEGAHVKKGDLLMTADLKAIEEAGKKIITPIIVTNSEDYVSVKATDSVNVQNGDNLLTVV
ncbi:PTS system beta-glucoside-specific IIA component, Glc family /PTS system beta-glucoside-specific IIB component, Glc family /PTS system beta-glucoside-specific IIC component, Glc family [Oribacterium sp. KHPX15]|uniref:beta-glucoside-specific PTS transporter subunit IIABC n=1 Tax=Oribacterium sp. KHPX15 TaxID=1855342 RepID=UPI0008941B79|nr:beta-glucoside-specific PTS transporter subunit IIABC [Oribacterium sp. KHPX15]SEA04846.1 PTS system beta-glucoside-specific IIA component, Glc family /PTS system beta-glucoside-specific IIB component, Glc family /PTS system beta-glucoside-specific IIC component, Glc family [Oribacterium sp. KHPX15]